MTCYNGTCGDLQCSNCNPATDADYSPSLCEKLVADIIKNLGSFSSGSAGCSQLRTRGIKVPVITGILHQDYNTAEKPSAPNEFTSCDVVIVEYNNGVYIYTGVDKEISTSSNEFIFLNPAVAYQFQSVAAIDKVNIKEANLLIPTFSIPAANSSLAGVMKPAEYNKVTSNWARFSTTAATPPANLLGRWVGDKWIGSTNNLYIWNGSSWVLVSSSSGSGGVSNGTAIKEVGQTSFSSADLLSQYDENNEGGIYKVVLDDVFTTKPLLYCVYDDQKNAIIPDNIQFGFSEQYIDPNDANNTLTRYYVKISLSDAIPANTDFIFVYGADNGGSGTGTAAGNTYITPTSSTNPQGQIVNIDNTKIPGEIVTNSAAFTTELTLNSNKQALFTNVFSNGGVRIEYPSVSNNYRIGLSAGDRILAANEEINDYKPIKRNDAWIVNGTPITANGVSFSNLNIGDRIVALVDQVESSPGSYTPLEVSDFLVISSSGSFPLFLDTDDWSTANNSKAPTTAATEARYYSKNTSSFIEGVKENNGKVELGGLITVDRELTLNNPSNLIKITKSGEDLFTVKREDSVLTRKGNVIIGKDNATLNSGIVDSPIRVEMHLDAEKPLKIKAPAPNIIGGYIPYGTFDSGSNLDFSGRVPTVSSRSGTGEILFTDFSNTNDFQWTSSGYVLQGTNLIDDSTTTKIKKSYFNYRNNTIEVFEGVDANSKDTKTLVYKSPAALTIFGQLSRSPMGVVYMNLNFDITISQGSTFKLLTVAQIFRPNYDIPVVFFGNSNDIHHGILNSAGDLIVNTTNSAVAGNLVINLSYENVVQLV